MSALTLSTPVSRVLRQPEQIHGTSRNMGDEILHARWIAVERGDRRHHHGPHLGHRDHIAQVREMQRRFAGKQNQPATLLELHIGRPGEEVIVIPVAMAARDRIEQGATIIPAVRTIRWQSMHRYRFPNGKGGEPDQPPHRLVARLMCDCPARR